MSKKAIKNKLSELGSEVAKEWHFSKNGDLKPYDVAYKSNKKVWWECNKGHEWLSTVAHRQNGRGCPYCCIGPK